MGFYSEYLDRKMEMAQLNRERKAQLHRISALREDRDVLVFAADLSKNEAPISMDYTDLLPIGDQLANLHGAAIDVILETPGGSGEVAEDIVRLLRDKYPEVAFIVPGWAKSAGTIMVMAGDNILMGPASAIGPIDAQLFREGKVFSADALLEGMEKIKKEVEQTGRLNKAYIPILQAVSPGELQNAENLLKFARELVTDWLIRHKFKNWTHHSSGQPVTDDQRQTKAAEIAAELCNHRKWLTHGRSIKIGDLRQMGLRITDYSEDPALSDAIGRYYTLLRMTFSGNIYKVIETPDSQIYRFHGARVPLPAALSPAAAEVAHIEVACAKCNGRFMIQANLGKPSPLQQGCLPFPANNVLNCPNCGNPIDVSDARRQIEAQSKKPVVS